MSEETAAKRVKYDPRHLSSAGPAAQKLAAADGHIRYIVPTAYGWKILTDKPPAWQKCVTVYPDGSHD